VTSNSPNTISYYKTQRSLTRRIIFSRTTLGVIGKSMAARCGSFKDAHPEVEAMRFYLLNHAVADLSIGKHPLQPLTAMEDKVFKSYWALGSDELERAFYYLLVICLREMRHLKSTAVDGPGWSKLTAGFITSIPDTPDEAMKLMLKVAETKYSGLRLGEVTCALEHYFFEGSFSNSSFGGPAWGAIAAVLRQFVHGEISGELLLDIVWALAHNGGPIFNKLFLYKPPNKDTLITILDVQRAGQIPQYVASLKDFVLSKILPGIKPGLLDPIFTLHEIVAGLAPSNSAFRDTGVDWAGVVAAGAVGSYALSKQPAPKGLMSPQEISHTGSHTAPKKGGVVHWVESTPDTKERST